MYYSFLKTVSTNFVMLFTAYDGNKFDVWYFYQ